MRDDEHELPERVLAAARDDLAAFRPDRTPPFSALQARRRRRDLRRGGAALAATALAVAGIAVVPASLKGGADPAPARVAAGPGPDEAFRYAVGVDGREAADEASAEALDRCLRLPGLSDGLSRYSHPPQYTGRVTGRARAEEFAACVEAVPGRSVTLTAEAGQPDSGPDDDGQAVDWTGAQVCVLGGPGQCRALGRDEARSLHRRLEAAEPAPADQAYCTAAGTVYSVLFEHPSVKPVPFEVPYLCGPVTVGAEQRLLDQAGRDAVRLAHETGDPDAPTLDTTGGG